MPTDSVRSYERNKIKILLRSRKGYVIIGVTQGLMAYWRSMNETLFGLSANSSGIFNLS